MSPTPMMGRLRRLAGLTATLALVTALVPAPVAGLARIPRLPDGSLTDVTRARIALVPIASGLSNPVVVTQPPDTSNRLFVVEKTGRIRVIRDGSLRTTPFLDIRTSVSTSSEQGLLGLAFHPSFASNRKLYVSYTNTAGNSVIREYLASASSPDVVQAGSGRTLLTVTQPYANHNGGHIAFGPDGYLYIGLGDGGDAGDPGNRSQDLTTLLGKILRIDVSGTSGGLQYRIPSDNPFIAGSGRDEIWSYGLRNPWRFSFDRATGAMWIGDVGQGSWEEVNRARTLGAAAGGRAVNYGWRVLEGRHCFNPSSGCSMTGKQPPLAEYSHAGGRCSVTGGYVYRGSRIIGLVGGYVFADFCSGEIFVVHAEAAAPATPVLLLDTGLFISSFGEDRLGTLYVADLGGWIYRVVQG